MPLLHPESDLSLSILAQGGHILKLLDDANGPVVVDVLLENHLAADRRRSVEQFFLSLDFLYAVGAIKRYGYRLAIRRDGNQSEMFPLEDDADA